MDPSLSSIQQAPLPPPIIPVAAADQTTALPADIPPNSNHPPYSDMICEAIGALKEMNGSTKKAIEKYIESTHQDLPPTHAALLGHHLKTLRNNGVLVMVKNSYKLASAAVGSEAKRGRGRPPKPKAVVPAADSSSGQQLVPFSDVPKKSPGRLRKNKPVLSQLGNILKVPGRGRPPKTGLKKSPGQPKKPKTVRSVVGANAMKKGRGRPRKASNQLATAPQAVPYADSDAAAATTVSRPRGRPKGTTRAISVGVHGRPRGRPPRFGGVAAKPIEPTGRPVGRPKKTTDGAKLKALAAANGDLKKTLEFFQFKVKQAVEALKPQSTSESNSSAIGALVDLEGLAAMQISTSMKVADAQLPSAAAPPPPVQPPVASDEGQVL